MRKSIVGLVAEQEPRKVVSLVEKTLDTKMRFAIFEQARVVAKKTYGTLKEYYGGDEQPDYYNRDDNSYAAFFANALKKFGVNGPEDFTDEATKQQFFKYVDANWKAQDAVQGQNQVGGGAGGFENGTQTRLPAPAMRPMPPDAVPQGNEPSVATMAPNGPSDAKNQPLTSDGDDSDLDVAQAGGGVPCPHCKGTGQAQVCPTCGKPMGDLDTDPDLEIGDDDTVDDEDGNTNFDDEPEDELTGNGGEDDDEVPADLGDEDELEDDPEAADIADEDQDEDEEPEDEDSDDAFDDEDAYTIDPSELQSEDQDEDEDEDSDLENDDEDEDNDEEPEDEDSDLENDEDSDEDEDEDSALPMKKVAEDYEQDNQEDANFMVEAIQMLNKKKTAISGLPSKKKKVAVGQIGDIEKRLGVIQKHLDGVKNARNSMLKSLRKQRIAIKKDPSMHPDKKRTALKMLAQMAAENRTHFKDHAKKIKALHIGR